MSDNIDANDDLLQHGEKAVAEALNLARDTLPPFAPYDDDEPKPSLHATPFVWRDETEIPRREWLYGRHLIRKFLSLDIAPGGLGKSSVKIVEALSLASGHALLGKAIHGGPFKVWLYNLEDPADETERRFAAAAKYFKLGPDHFGDRLFADTGREQELCIAEETDGGARILRPVIEALTAEIQSRGIDVLIVDPFVSSHRVSENDNRAIDMVAKEWSRIADVCNCSINLVHHVRKTNGQEVTAESSRGAVSLIGAARSVNVYNRMTKEEGERAGIEPDKRGFYFRISNDKANLAPPEAADWHRMNNVELDNGDSVGVACPWEWPDSFEGVTSWHLKQVQARVSEGQFRRDSQAKAWVGSVIAEVCDLDAKKHRARINDIIKTWVETNMLCEVEGEDDKRNKRTFVEVGTWHAE